jgi:hypothetical protein
MPWQCPGNALAMPWQCLLLSLCVYFDIYGRPKQLPAHLDYVYVQDSRLIDTCSITFYFLSLIGV